MDLLINDEQCIIFHYHEYENFRWKLEHDSAQNLIRYIDSKPNLSRSVTWIWCDPSTQWYHFHASRKIACHLMLSRQLKSIPKRYNLNGDFDEIHACCLFRSTFEIDKFTYLFYLNVIYFYRNNLHCWIQFLLAWNSFLFFIVVVVVLRNEVFWPVLI